MSIQPDRKNSRRRKAPFPRVGISPFHKTMHSLERLELRVLLAGDPSLGLTLSPTLIAENAGAGAVTGTITRNNMDTTQALTVNLTSSDTAHATVAPSVTIAAGAASGTFSVNPVDDNVADGTHTVAIAGYAPSPVAVGLDSTFGSGGYDSVPLPVNSSAGFPGVGLDANGNIVAVALAANGNWAVTRALPNGTPDTSFGGTGTVVTAFPGATESYATSVAFQPDGKIVVAGTIRGTNPFDTWGVARYNSDGSLDNGFGAGGLYQFSFNSTNGDGGWAYGVAVQSDGSILVGGMLRGTGMGFSVARLTATGALDTSFGTNGVASIDVSPGGGSLADAMLLQPDGKILMTGYTSNPTTGAGHLAVARFTTMGAPDTTFNGTGFNVITSAYHGYALALQSDGKIVVTGGQFQSTVLTVRLKPDGTLDSSFNGTGMATADFVGLTDNDTGYGVAVQADGKIIVGGLAISPEYSLGLLRYNENGTLDTSFSPTGTLTFQPPDSFEGIRSVALQADGKLVAIANGSGTGGSFTQIVRFDTGLLAASAAVNVTDTDASGSPTAAVDNYQTIENSPLSVAAPGVLGNDTQINSTALSAALVSGPSHGSLTLNADGSFHYTPAAGFSGVDSFAYDDTEGNLTSNTAIVTIAVKAPVGDPALTLTIAPTSFAENAGAAAAMGTVTRVNTDNAAALTVNLTSSNTNQAAVPASVVIPAGQASTTFNIDAVDDRVVTGTQTVAITAAADAALPLSVVSTFGSGGSVSQNYATQAVAVQSDGKVVIAGRYYTGNASSNYYDATVSRYNADGTPDNTFGTNGSVTTDISGQSDKPYAVLVQPDGKIVVGGIGGDGPNFFFELARYNPNGTLDSSFGSGGTVVFNNQTGYSEIWDLALQSDGKILAAGNANGGMAVARLNPDGSLDTNFGNTGIASVSVTPPYSDRAFGVALQSNGDIVLTGTTEGGNSISEVAVVRFTPAGKLDSTFGSGGVVKTDLPGSFDEAQDVVLQPDGKIVVAGATSPVGAYPPDYNVALIRYNEDGTLDTKFGSGGEVISDLGASDEPEGVTLQPDGMILVSGQTYPPGSGLSSYHAFLARYLPDGTLDGEVAAAAGGIAGQRLVLASDGEVFVVATGTAINSGQLMAFQAVAPLSSAAEVSVLETDSTTPAASNDSYAVLQNSTLTVSAPGVQDNDSTANGTPLSSAVVSGPSHGSLSLNVDGSFSYTPASGFSGTDSFTYDDTEGAFTSNVATVTIAVQAPVAAGDTYTVLENSNLAVAASGVQGNDTAANSTPLSSALVSGPSHGSLTLNADGSFTYTPALGFSGSDSFTYDDTEGSAVSNTATVSITVQAPLAANDSYTVLENSTLTVSSPGVLANDTGVTSTAPSAVLVAGPSNGSLSLNADGSFVYTPAAGFSGRDSFTYDDTEGALTSNTATVTLTVNPVPMAGDDSYTVNENSVLNVAAPGVEANDTSVNPYPLSAVYVSGLRHGGLTFHPDGSFVYTPVANFHGSDSFTYYDTEGGLTSNVATVTITVNQVPVAVADNYTVSENGTLTVAAAGVLANDLPASSTPLTPSLVSGPSHGVVNLNADGSFVYTPATGFSGSDSFTYHDSEDSLTSNAALVAITVTPLPVAVNDSYSTNENTQLVTTAPAVTSLSMVSQTGDVIGQGQTYNFTPATGSFSVSSPYNNELVFGYQDDNPNEWWHLTFAAPYGNRLVPGTYDNATRAPFQAASDPGLDVSGDGRGSNTLTGSFVVSQAVYDSTGKIISFDATFVQHDGGATPALTGEIKYNATPGIGGVQTNDIPGTSAPLSSVLVTGPSHGTVALNANGSFTYTPVLDFFGADSFTYDDTEGSVTSNIATVNITVSSVNQAPSFSEGPNQPIAEGAGAQTVANWATNISAGAPNESGQTLTFQVSTNDDALFSVLPAIDPSTGTLTYTPAAGAIGSATVSVLLHDNGGTANGGIDTSAPQTFTITVNNVAPTVNLGGNVTVNEGDTMSATGSFTDPGTETWTATVDYGDGGGPQSLPLNADKTFSLSHVYADNGSYTVTVVVSDSNGGAGTSSFVVAAANVAPTDTFTNNGPIDEGSVVKISFGSSPFDPSSVDTGDGFSYSIATTQAALAASYTAAGPSPWATMLFDDNGSYTVYGRIFDKDNGYTDYSTIVTVNNVAPTANLAASATAPEGTTVGIVVLNNQSDPSRADTSAGFHYAFAFNDSSSFDTGDGTYGGSSTSNVGSIPARVLADGPAVVTIRARIIDKDGGYTDYSTTMDVLNVAPTATISAPPSVSEGATTATVALTAPLDPSPIDTAAGFHYAFDFNNDGTFDLGDGTFAGSSAAAAATIPESYLDDGPGTLSVRERILDKDGGYSDYTATIVINNVAPTATLVAPGSVNEGGSASVALSNAADPSQADTNAGFRYAFSFSAGGTTVNLGDGTYAGSLAASAASVPASMLSDGPATVTVQAWVIDKDNAATQYSTTIVVNNVAPTATLVSPPPTNEGTTANVSLVDPVDPSQADINAGFHYSFALNRSSLSTSYAAASAAASAPLLFDDNGNVTVYGRIFDKDGGYTDYSTAVTVLNIAPTATFSNDGPIDEGGVVKVSFSNAADPSTADTQAGFHYSINTSATGLADSYSAAGPSTWATMSFNDNGAYTVYGRVFDKDGGYTDYTTTVIVNNVAPTATLSAPSTVAEGGVGLVALNSPFDPSSADTIAGLHYAFAFNESTSFDFGDGSYAGSDTSNVVAVPSNLLADGPATIAVRARIIDKDGGYTDYTATVTVTNVAPTATMAAPTSVTEGSSMVAQVALSGAADPSPVDKSAGLRYAYDFNNDGAFDLGDGTYGGSVTTSSSVIPEQFMDDGPGQFTVRERVIDKDGGYNDYTATILITNVAPTATLSNGGAVNEGSPATVSFTNASDPSTADVQAGLHYSFATSMAGLAATYAAAGTSTSSQFTFDEEGSYTVYGRILDKDNGSTDYTTVVTVNDVAPTATLTNSGPVNEGSAVTVSFANAYSPSPSDTAAGFEYSFALTPAGLATSYTAASTSSSDSLTFNDNGSYTVYGRILDHDGASTDYSTVVVVNNVAPTATLSNGGAVNEGSPATVSFTNASDPSTADLRAGLHYSFATSTASLAATYAAAGTATSSQFTFDEGGSYTVYGRIFDKDNGSTDYTTVVTVNDVAPTATLTNSGPVNEGSAVTVSFANAYSPSPSDTAAGFHYSFALTPAGLATSYIAASTSGSDSLTFNDNGSYTVYGRILDHDGAFSDYSTVVAVNNVAPTATVSGPTVAVRGQPQAFTFTADDPANQAATFTYTVDWGDGSQQTFSGAAATIEQMHAYAGAGSYKVTVSVTDDGGAGSSLPASLAVTVYAAALEGTDLDIGSTTGSDTIVVSPTDLNGDLSVTINGVSQGVFHPTGEMVVYSQGGGDQITLRTARFGRTTAYVNVPAVLFGGAGNDTIDARGSTANDVLVGSLGNDTLYGGKGRNLLIGGAGKDKLYAGSAGDILIAGSTDYDANLAALNAIMQEWGSSDSYQTRVNDLLEPSGGQNGAFFLNAGTVHDDAAVDYLYGGSGQDWFFYDPSSPYADVLKNRHGNETVTGIANGSEIFIEHGHNGHGAS